MKYDSIPSFIRKKKIICSRKIHGKDEKWRDFTFYSCISFRGSKIYFIKTELDTLKCESRIHIIHIFNYIFNQLDTQLNWQFYQILLCLRFILSIDWNSRISYRDGTLGTLYCETLYKLKHLPLLYYTKLFIS